MKTPDQFRGDWTDPARLPVRTVESERGRDDHRGRAARATPAGFVRPGSPGFGLDQRSFKSGVQTRSLSPYGTSSSSRPSPLTSATLRDPPAFRGSSRLARSRPCSSKTMTRCGPFEFRRLEADRSPPVAVEIRESQPASRSYCWGYPTHRRSRTSGPVPSRPSSALSTNACPLSGRRLLGDDDLGPLVAVQVGDGELGTRHGAGFEVEPERPEQSAVAKRERPQFVVGTPVPGRTPRATTTSRAPSPSRSSKPGAGTLAHIIRVLMLAQRDIPEDSSIASRDARQPGLDRSPPARVVNELDGTNGLPCRTKTSGTPCGSTTRASTQWIDE